MMTLKQYHEGCEQRSVAHAENVLKYGATAPFGYPDMFDEQRRRIEFILSFAQGETLDIGCDSGYILNECKGRAGLDISLSRVKACKHWFPSLNVVNAAAENLPFGKSLFDTVILAELLEHVIDPEAVLEEAFYVLKMDGRIIVTVPDELGVPLKADSPEHLRKYSFGSLKSVLLAHFDFLEATYIDGEYPDWCMCCVKKEDSF